MPASKYHLTVSEKRKIIEIYDSLPGHLYKYVSRKVTERLDRKAVLETLANAPNFPNAQRKRWPTL